MEEQLITFKTAKLAYEKGFKLPQHINRCRYYTDEPKPSNWAFRKIIKWDKLPKYSAPTQSIIQKWLRVVHGMNVTPFLVGIRKKPKYKILILQLDENGVEYTSEPISTEKKYFNSYEEALEKGLIEVLKSIKLKK